MKILFLDDNDRRHKEFKRNSIGHVVDHCRSAADAIQRLQEKDYDRIYLDFDLTEDPQEASMDDYENGQVVADWIAANLPSPSALFIIHSLSISGASSMLSTLRSANLKAICVQSAWKVSPEEIKK